MTDLSRFQRRPPPLRDEPPLRVTTRDVGRKIGLPEDHPDNLEILANEIPEGCSIEEAKVIAEQILTEVHSQTN